MTIIHSPPSDTIQISKCDFGSVVWLTKWGYCLVLKSDSDLNCASIASLLDGAVSQVPLTTLVVPSKATVHIHHQPHI